MGPPESKPGRVETDWRTISSKRPSNNTTRSLEVHSGRGIPNKIISQNRELTNSCLLSQKTVIGEVLAENSGCLKIHENPLRPCPQSRQPYWTPLSDSIKTYGNEDYHQTQWRRDHQRANPTVRKLISASLQPKTLLSDQVPRTVPAANVSRSCS